MPESGGSTLSLKGSLETPMSRRDFLGLGAAALGTTLISPREVLAGEEVSDEKYVEFHRKGLLDVYNVDIQFEEGIDWRAQKICIESTLHAISFFPPRLFNTIVDLFERTRNDSLQSQSVYVHPNSEAPRTSAKVILFEKGNLSDNLLGYAPGLQTQWFCLDSADVSKNPYQGVYGFIHEFGHTIHQSLMNPKFTGYDSSVFDCSLGLSDEGLSKLKGLLLEYPGFASAYSLYSEYENFAETFSQMISNPNKAFSEISNPKSELALKYIAVADILYLLSGGLMDAQYWRDLFVGKVDFNYWLKKESTPFPKVIEEGDSMYYFLNLGDNPIAPDTAYLRISKDSDNIDSEPSDFRDVQDSCNFTLGTRSIRLRKGVYCEDQDSVTINYLCGDLPRHFAKIPVGFENKVTLTIATVDMIGSYEMYSEKNDEDGDFVIKVKPIKAFDIRKNPELQQEYSALLKPDVHFWGGFALAISGGAMELTTAHMNRRHFLELVSAALFLGGSSVVIKSFFDIYRISNGLQPKKFTDYSGLKRRYWGEENI